MKKWLKTLLFDVVALILGISLALAFAPYEIFPLAVIAPAGLLLLLLNASPKRAFWLGFVFGIGMFGLGVYWVYISVHLFGDVPYFLAGVITSLLIAILALFPATACYLTNRYFSSTPTGKILFAFPAIWVSSEWVRDWIFSGFPWLFLGYSQTNSPLKGFAPIFSVYGVSLAVILTSVLLVYALLSAKAKKYTSLYFCLLLCAAIWVTGGLLNLIAWTKPIGKSVAVSLVQGDVPQELKWSPEHLQLSFDRYRELTEPLWGKDKIIIWPEAAIPLPLHEAANYINAMDSKARATGSHLILGIPIRNSHDKDNEETYHNAIVTLGNDKGVYLKRRLVPFGEYVPLMDFLSPLFDYLNIPVSNLVPGKSGQPLLTVGGVKILPAICYEIAFPDLVRTMDPTVGFILTITNDAWFGDSSAQAQHLQMASMRAMELKRPVVFVSNDGITAIIGPDGNIDSQVPTHKIAVLNDTVQPMTGLTPWMRNGVDPILFILICFIAMAIRYKRSQKQLNITASDYALLNGNKEHQP